MSNSESIRSNNFDALRLGAAFSVLISHHFALNGLPEPTVYDGLSLGMLGLVIFFSISGFLVSQSWRRDPHVARFLAKRFLRIWPALAVFTAIAALILGPVISTLDWRAYFAGSEFGEFFYNLNLFSIRSTLPGVFESNTFSSAVNGSLWTIPLEVGCYLALLLVGVVGLTNRPSMVAFGTFCVGLYFFNITTLAPGHRKILFGLFFFGGVCLDLFRSKWEGRTVLFPSVVCLVTGVLLAAGAAPVAPLIVVTCGSVFLGTRSTPILRRIGRYGDFSYGVYIYAFAVQQIVLWAGGKNLPFWPGLFIAAVATSLLAVLSWYAIERPALALKVRLGQDTAAGKVR